MDLVVEGSLFWSIAVLNLTKQQFSRVRGMQQKMCRAIVGTRRAQHEDDAEFFTRANRAVKLWFEGERWDQRFELKKFLFLPLDKKAREKIETIEIKAF